MKKFRTNENPETNPSRDNEKIELSRQQQNPGAARPEDFQVELQIIGGGERGNSKAELNRILRDRDRKRRKPYQSTPERNDVNEAGKPGEGLG